MPAFDRTRRRPRPWMRPRTYDGWIRPAGYIGAAGDWIHTLRPWGVFATLTFVLGVSQERADAALFRWSRMVARHRGEHVTVAFASDYQTSGFLHFHVLLAFELSTTCTPELLRLLDQLWKTATFDAGWTEVREFQPEKGAAYYTATHREVAVGIACPRRRAACRRPTGCCVTRAPL